MGRVFFKQRADVLAFGLLPAFRRYELRQARYTTMAGSVRPQLEGLERTADIIDIGAGHGEAKIIIDTLGVPARWVGVELSPAGASACQAAGYDEMLTDLDLERDRLPGPDESYDVVIASHILEHLENAKDAIEDWYRVLRPGGVLVLGVPMHFRIEAWFHTRRLRRGGRKPRAHCHFFSMRSLKVFLAQYPVQRIFGFRVVSARKQLPLEDWRWFSRVSMWIGRRFPGLTAEVNVEIVKPGRLQP